MACVLMNIFETKRKGVNGVLKSKIEKSSASSVPLCFKDFDFLMAETSQSAKPQTNEFPFSVSVGQVYDGPLDLLLVLVRKQDIDIYDIPIAKITAQYLGYVENLKHLDVDIAAEFIYMASLLIHVKARCCCRAILSQPTASRKIRATNWCSGCWNMKNSRTPRKC